MISQKSQDFRFRYTQLRSRLSSVDFRSKSKEVIGDLRVAGQSSALKAGGSAANTLQTLLIIWIASVLITYEQEVKQDNLLGKSIDERTRSEKLLEITNKTINRFDIFSGIAFGGSFGLLLSKPLGYISLLIAQPGARSVLAKLISTGAASLVTFIGWEFGRQLWTEAIYQLDSKDEITAAESLLLTEIISGQATAEQVRLFNKVQQNAWAILTFVDPELTQIWIYNTWRLSLMKGEFFTLVASMTASATATSTVVGTFAPGAGHVVSFISVFLGGLAGVFIAEKLPSEIKNSITAFLRGGRINLTNSKLYVNSQELLRIGSYFRPFQNTPYLPERLSDEFSQYLSMRSHFRNNMVTTHFESIFTAYSKNLIFETSLTNLEIVQGKDSAKLKNYRSEVDPLIAELRTHMKEKSDQIIDIYAKEIRQMVEVQKTLNRTAPLSMFRELEKQISELTTQLQFLISILSPFNPDIINNEALVVLAPSQKVFEEYLNGFYFFGYRESAIRSMFHAEEKTNEKH